MFNRFSFRDINSFILKTRQCLMFKMLKTFKGIKTENSCSLGWIGVIFNYVPLYLKATLIVNLSHKDFFNLLPVMKDN